MLFLNIPFEQYSSVGSIRGGGKKRNKGERIAQDDCLPVTCSWCPSLTVRIRGSTVPLLEPLVPPAANQAEHLSQITQ